MHKLEKVLRDNSAYEKWVERSKSILKLNGLTIEESFSKYSAEEFISETVWPEWCKTTEESELWHRIEEQLKTC